MNDTYKWLIIISAVMITGALAYSYLTMPDKRSVTEKVGDAIHELPQGTDKAARQLENRTPIQKMGDSVKDARNKIEEDSNP